MQASASLPLPRPTSSLRVWALHLLCLVLPVFTLAFVASGPHAWYASLPWFLIVPALVLLDHRSGPAEHDPVEAMAAWPFDAVLVVLAALQIANVALAARLASVSGLGSADAWVTVLLVGVSSGYSAIVVAHELIHRKSRALQLLGRLLLVTTLYEHFFTEHVRGHHARVATELDPATARFGETATAFLVRTVPGQFRSAWRLEAKRLGDEGMPLHDPRLLHSAVVHGLFAEALLLAAVGFVFGPAAVLVFVLQALVAIRLLEAVNYFEHYGLQRSGKKVRPVDSWDSDSWVTLFALVGLSRHADHHAYAARPYQSLRLWDESPKLPCGYLAMVVLVLFDDGKARRLLHAELERKKLGPFAEQI